MNESAPTDVTELLMAWSRGDESALSQLVPSIDGELRRIARTCLEKEHFECTQTTSLVNEAYIRLIDGKRVQWHDAAHFGGSRPSAPVVKARGWSSKASTR